MSYEVLQRLSQTGERIRTACKQIRGEDCLPAHNPEALLWGIARSTADRITTYLSPDSTAMLLEVVLKALALIVPLLEGSEEPDGEMVTGQLGLITALLDRVLDQERKAFALEDEASLPDPTPAGTLDGTPAALDELEGGQLDAREEDLTAKHFLTGAQQEHRLIAMRELQTARGLLEAEGHLVELLSAVTDPPQDD